MKQHIWFLARLIQKQHQLKSVFLKNCDIPAKPVGIYKSFGNVFGNFKILNPYLRARAIAVKPSLIAVLSLMRFNSCGLWPRV